MSKVYLSLGSNIGERKRHLFRAIHNIKAFIDIQSFSPIYHSSSWGFSGNDFYNMCLWGYTSLDAFQLIQQLFTVEQTLGRVRKDEKGFENRVIDLDILLFDRQIIQKENLEIPHRHMIHRLFVLKPLVDIAPEAYHPIEKMTIKNLLEKCSDKTPLTKLAQQVPQNDTYTYRNI